jgi:DNA-binding transcriptional regulator YiaG
MTKNFRSDIAAAIHESASDLHGIGLINSKTMHDFDKTLVKKKGFDSIAYGFGKSEGD